jgi:hypothetical protein
MRYEALSAWCPECETGFALPINSSENPTSWKYPTCDTIYPLDASILRSPINLYLEDELPEEVRTRVQSIGTTVDFINQNFIFILAVILALIFIILSR